MIQSSSTGHPAGVVWFICANSLIIGKTEAKHDTSDVNLNMEIIPEIIAEGLMKVKAN